jgi:hypothetical protein
MFIDTTGRERIAATRIAGTVVSALVVLMTLWLGMRPAAAAPDCDTHAGVSRELKRSYGEEPVAVGLSEAGNVIQVFARDDGASWTIVVAKAEGISCKVAAGQAWQPLPKTPRGPAS